MDSFERAAINILRGTNLAVMIAIIGAGLLVALGLAEKNIVLAGLAVLGSVLVAGLVTGLLALFCQIYEQGEQQIALLRALAKKKEGGQ